MKIFKGIFGTRYYFGFPRWNFTKRDNKKLLATAASRRKMAWAKIK